MKWTGSDGKNYATVDPVVAKRVRGAVMDEATDEIVRLRTAMNIAAGYIAGNQYHKAEDALNTALCGGVIKEPPAPS